MAYMSLSLYVDVYYTPQMDFDWVILLIQLNLIKLKLFFMIASEVIS